MSNAKKHLQNFIDLKIDQKQLYELVKQNNEKFTIYSKDIIYVLKKYMNGKIDQEKLLEWVNTIWFSNLYKYNDEELDCIVEVMHALEELDERTHPLSFEETEYYIDILKKNKIIPFRSM